MPRISEVHCPDKLRGPTNGNTCDTCNFFEKVQDGNFGGANYYCTKKGVVT